MHLQAWIAALLVIGCALHAAWRLMPSALRRILSARLFHRELPASSGCAGGCDGCGSAAEKATKKATKKAAPAAGAAQPIAFHPRRQR